MPTKRTTNKLSQLYKTIDQKELSADAKKALADLRIATGNFRKKEGKEADAFMLFYNRLVNKKPTAVKTTKEYKAMLTERRRENGRKAMEARKAKQESRQGQGSERDAARPAKPFGWRLKGKHNYRKPTREDIRTGKAYYEARIDRADSKRTKFPMLERGGFMADGGAIENQYQGREAEDIWNNLTFGQRLHFLRDHESDLKLKVDGMPLKDYLEETRVVARLKFSELNKKIQDEFALHTIMGQYADGGYIESGEKLYEIANNMSDNEFQEGYRNLSEKEKDMYDILLRLGDENKIALVTVLNESKKPKYDKDTWDLYTYADGGYMAKGGILEERALKLFDKLKQDGKLKRYIDTRGGGKKYFETIVENSAENGYWKRYESTTRGNIGTLQNEYLDKNDVINHLKKTMPTLEENAKMAKGGVFYTDSHKQGH